MTTASIILSFVILLACASCRLERVTAERDRLRKAAKAAIAALIAGVWYVWLAQ
jgi:hypothetical protein